MKVRLCHGAIEEESGERPTADPDVDGRPVHRHIDWFRWSTDRRDGRSRRRGAECEREEGSTDHDITDRPAVLVRRLPGHRPIRSGDRRRR